MADAKHTPGPWFATRDGGCDTLIRAGDCETGRRIATTFAAQPPARRHKSDSDARKAYIRSCQTNEANARLIAAAPELLEALKAIFAAMHPDIPGAPGSAIEKARAAIAKATGSAS